MDANLPKIVGALTALMVEENGALDGHAGRLRLNELARIKVRLVGQLECEVARRRRLDERCIDDDERNALVERIEALEQAGRENAAALLRQMELTSSLLDALVAEARRVSSRRASTYGAAGELTPPDPSVPIAIDSRF